MHYGIAFGPTAIPPALYGSRYTGTKLSASPTTLLANLEAARRTNTRVLLNFTGHESRISDVHGFSMTKWKNRVDRFRGIDFSSYIADGTIIGHIVMDEPQDRNNWNGTTVSPAEVEEMARYSKQIWPSLPTIVRAFPAYLQGYHYQYLDAAWAQYLEKFGDLNAFLSTNVRDAKASGLALVS
ncbi:MAG: hypothetical protein ACJ8BF_03695 [Gemmatimonadales bacterium]